MYYFGPFHFDPETGYLRRGNENVPLPPRAQDLLSYLLKRPGQVVTKEEIQDGVWGDVHVTDTSLKEAIHVLRLALGDTPRSATYVETVPRRGYRFVKPVRLAAMSGTRRFAVAGWWIGGVTLGLALSLLILSRFSDPESEPATVPQRFAIQLPPEHRLTPGPPNLALSPDGRHLAYVAKSSGQRRLFLRPVARVESVAVAGSDGANAPFFSPDGRWLGFFTADGMHRVAVDGGRVETLCDLPSGLAASWGSRSIVLSLLEARANTGLWEVPSAGGRPRVLTTLLEDESAHRWPEVLPGGDAVLFTVWRSGFEDAETVLLDLETGERSALLAGSNARFAAPGHLLFLRRDQLWSVPFDLRRRQVAGEPALALSGVATTPVVGTAHFAVATMGSLVFVARTEPPVPVLRRLGDNGETTRVEIDVDGQIHDLRLAPNERFMAVTVLRDSGIDLWVMDLERGSLSRRTFDGTSMNPVWSPDSRWLLVVSRRQSLSGVFRLAADGTSEGEALWTGDGMGVATSWSPDGRHIALSRLIPDGGWDLWMLPQDAPAEPWLATPFNESRAVISPDGQFLAYESDETGNREVYVRPLLGSGAQWKLSTAGGSHPQWSRDGRQIWFRQGAEIYSVDVRFEPAVEIGQPASRFQGSDVPGHNLAIGDVALWILEPQSTPEPTLTFVVNGLADL